MPYCVQCGTVLSANSSQVGSGTVVQNSAPIAPSPPTSYGTFPANPPTAPAYPFDPYTQSPLQRLQPPSVLQKKRSINPLLIVCILVALTLVIGAVVFAVIRTDTPTNPMLASAYAGSVHNNTVNITSAFTLKDIVEDTQGNISGNAHVALPLAGSGPFQGSVNADSQIHFTIKPNDNSGVSAIYCLGTVESDGSLKGNYTVSGTGETGTWQVK